LTGDAAVWGQNVKKGVTLALDEVNEKGGVKGKKIEVIYEDSEGLPNKAVTALNKLVDTNKVPAVIGDVASSAVLSMAPIAERRQVVLLSPGASNPDITNAGEYIFRNWHSDAAEGSYLAELAYKTLKMRLVGIIYVNNAYGKGLEDVFSKTFTQLGGKIVAAESFRQNDTDFRSQLTRMREFNPDGIFMPGYPKEMPEVLKQAKQLGIRKQFLCPSAFEDPQILTLAGQAAVGVVYVYPKQGDSSKAHVATFYQNYEKRYGQPPGALSDTGYDALTLLVEAMRSSGLRGPEIKDGLLKIKSFSGVAGETTFDQNGDIVKGFNLKTVKDGKFVDY
jgi:branched-chain amino acid transport system substrate-binding protein